MCGLAGFLQPSGLCADGEMLVAHLADTLSHRGPDDSGTWVDADAGIALGHRRLSVIDLSPAGHQPMFSASGRYVIAFNGEVYNHLEIRKELEQLGSAPTWRGHSDTETLLEGFDCWGIEQNLKKTIGMFAFSVWDRREHTLTLARDRMGEKPLYYGWQGSTFLFGSELKALRAHPVFQAGIDRNVLALYMQCGNVPSPYSIYEGIYKLPPGTYLTLAASENDCSLPAPRSYWSLREVAENAVADRFRGDHAEAIDELQLHLQNAVSMQSVADVPLGAFLSGGIDSTVVVALMQMQSSRPVKTFTMGFYEADYQEAQYAKAVAQHLGTDHTEMYVTPREAIETVPKLPTLFDEPFGDSSAIPTFLVSRLARTKVTVSLSGDGGDELFGGYTRYQRTNDIWRVARWIPRSAGRLLSHSLRAIPRLSRVSSAARRANRMALYLAARTGEECYDAQMLQCFDDPNLVLGSDGSPSRTLTADSALPGGHLYDNMMYMDAVTYLPDDILVKVDRTSMGVSLETRVPMLDHRVIEFAWRLPLYMKVRDGEGKWLLKQLLQKHIPGTLVGRPKMGFGVPIAQWVRGALRDWAESFLSENRLRQDGFLDASVVRKRWLEHVNGTAPGADDIWHVLAFQAWLASISSH